jgi:VanZ family protein
VLAIGLPLLLWLAGGAIHAQVRDVLVSPWDKLVHIAAYGLLTLALGLVLERCARLGRWSLALAFALAMAVGGVDEALQLLDAERKADIDDLLANFAGGVAALAVLGVRLHGRERRRLRAEDVAQRAAQG